MGVSFTHNLERALERSPIRPWFRLFDRRPINILFLCLGGSFPAPLVLRGGFIFVDVAGMTIMDDRFWRSDAIGNYIQDC
ncbi:hypothetical protein FNV43_RR09543 [Rhamnella rubrinervis]|uniref:Uncharacterized protein n=1 Tax=Rhamnella rubrinervis TaxID=2594499 RepID=A0A8K0HBF1_9ROSA|nr:hypothetical protein FNV43_RR09543 [Rhamnella rubrinervis]